MYASSPMERHVDASPRRHDRAATWESNERAPTSPCWLAFYDFPAEHWIRLKTTSHTKDTAGPASARRSPRRSTAPQQLARLLRTGTNALWSDAALDHPAWAEGAVHSGFAVGRPTPTRRPFAGSASRARCWWSASAPSRRRRPHSGEGLLHGELELNGVGVGQAVEPDMWIQDSGRPSPRPTMASPSRRTSSTGWTMRCTRTLDGRGADAQAPPRTSRPAHGPTHLRPTPSPNTPSRRRPPGRLRRRGGGRRPGTRARRWHRHWPDHGRRARPDRTTGGTGPTSGVVPVVDSSDPRSDATGWAGPSAHKVQRRALVRGDARRSGPFER